MVFAERMDAQDLTARLGGKWHGRYGKARCPAHDDHDPSLSISDGSNGKLLVKCHTGCAQAAVVDELKGRGLWPEGQPVPRLRVHHGGRSENGTNPHYAVPERPAAPQEVAAYTYTDETGTALFQSIRFAPKDFRQRQPAGDGTWKWNLDGVRLVPYRLPELLKAPASHPVYVVEGEKDVERLADIGFVATTNPMGAGKWRPEYAAYLRGRDVVILPDNDAVGEEHAQAVAATLRGTAASVRILHLPGLPEKGDVSDWMDAGNTPEHLHLLATEPTEPRLRALSAEELFSGSPAPVPWLIHAPSDAAGVVPGGLLAEGDTGIIGAASGTGKTWLMAELAFSLVTSLPLFDAFGIARPCRVMIVDEESSAWLLRRRWRQILAGHNVEPEAFVEHCMPNLRVYVDQGFSFDNDRALEGLYEEAEGFRPDVILYDTLARIHRRPENDNSEIAALFEDRIKPFRRRFNVAQLFAHHLRKPSKEAPSDPASMLRGASDLKGQLDQFWFLRGRTGESKAIFEHDKCRAMPELKPFVIERIDTDNGGVRIVKVGDAMAAGGTAAEQHRDVLLTFLVDQGRSTRQEVLEFAKGRGIGHNAVDAAMQTLLDEDQIDRVKVGKQYVFFATEME